MIADPADPAETAETDLAPGASEARPQPRYWPYGVVMALSGLTGVAAVVGLTRSGTELPCGKVCGVAPDSSVEGWLVAWLYVGLLNALSFARLFSEAAAGSTRFMPSYRGSVALLAVGSLSGAFLTPRSWAPLRPAFLVGGMACVVVLVFAPRFAQVLRPDQGI